MLFERIRRTAILRDGRWPGLVAGLAVALAVVVFGALGAHPSQVSALTPTLGPTFTPTPTPEPTLTWTIDVSPAAPVVGNDIKLTAFASGDGGLPKYTLILKDDPALLSLESAVSVITGGPLGEPASWDLVALGVGKAHFEIVVNYEREFCLPAGCFFNFTNENSPQASVEIAPAGVGGIALDGVAPLGERASGTRAVTWLAAAGVAAICLAAIGWATRRRLRN